MVSVQTLKRSARQNTWGYPGHGFYLKGHYKADGSPVFLRTVSRLKTWKRDPSRVAFSLKYGFWEVIRFDTGGYMPFPLSDLLTREPAARRRR